MDEATPHPLQADLLLTGISELVTPTGPGPKHGVAMSALTHIPDAAIAITHGCFTWIGKQSDWRGQSTRTLDLGHRAVVPGLIDPHTHAVWAGDRLADFELRTSGHTYEQILAAGGGIRSTIRATASASHDELIALAQPRIAVLVASGATSIEVKSGYGFTPAAELRQLKAIQALASTTPARILPTLLIHIPPSNPTERANYIAQIKEELIPEASSRGLAYAVDIFVEKEAFHPAEAQSILIAALTHGLSIKMHAEQFHAIGGLELALRLHALSVDHLEACTPQQHALFAGSNTIATILPGVSLHLGIPCAPGRSLIDAGAAVAVGTDLNPGSSPLFSTSAALALSVRLNGLTAAEALTAGTANAAAALGLTDAGRIEPGLPADLLVLHSPDWRDLLYTLGANPIREVWIAGKKTAGKEIAVNTSTSWEPQA